MTELKPCPFCGGPAEMHKPRSKVLRCSDERFLPRDAVIERKCRDGVILYQVPRYVPRCCRSDCAGRLGRQWPTPEDAASAWNKREKAPDEITLKGKRAAEEFRRQGYDLGPDPDGAARYQYTRTSRGCTEEIKVYEACVECYVNGNEAALDVAEIDMLADLIPYMEQEWRQTNA